MIEQSTLKSLEYNKILEKVASFASSNSGKDLIFSLLPSENFSDAVYKLNCTDQASKLLYNYIITTDFSIEDINESLNKSDKLVTLSMGEILEVTRVLRLSRLNKESIMSINFADVDLIKEIANALYVDKMLEDEVYSCIISEVEMADGASYELKQIRQAILKSNEMIKTKLTSYLSSHSKYLQDCIVTIRNNRYCLPVKSECRGQIPGLIHDKSASLATVFVEPFSIVEMNNEVANLRINEQEEINRILKVFTVKIASIVEEMKATNLAMVQLDCIFAKAQYGYATKSSMPLLKEQDELSIIRGRHPLIDKDKVVPITISMDASSRILVISGSNTGGKTVTMKLVGITTLMAMSGIFPLVAEGSVIKFFDNIFCDIGDNQSIEMNLSTFSSHLSNIVRITNSLTQNSLVMLDELGAGTDPLEGASLAVAVTKSLIEAKSYALITTHFAQMKDLSNKYDCVTCAGMDFDPITYAPTYRLIMRSSGSSNALRIAKRLGLRQDILDCAMQELPLDKIAYDKLMDKAERSKRQAEDYKEEIYRQKQESDKLYAEAKRERELLGKEREVLNEKLKRSANIAIAEYLEDAEDMIAELKECVNRGTEQDLFKARKVKSDLSKLEYKDNSTNIRKMLNTPIVVGDSVYIESFNADGEIISIDERRKEYLIRIGIAKSKVKFNQVEKIQSNKTKTEGTSRVNIAKKEFTNVALSLELNIIGQNTHDGVALLDKYLDGAKSSGYKEVRIVHGKGTGILRKAVHQYLKTSLVVDSFRLGNWGEGDTGVTIVALK